MDVCTVMITTLVDATWLPSISLSGP